MRNPFGRRSNSATPSGKVYLYVSDAKIEMLSAGLPVPLRERFDLKGTYTAPDVGFGSLGGEVGTRHMNPSRYQRAERLCDALEEQGRVGDIRDESAEFIRGTMLATWGFWNRWDEGYADVVFFTGVIDEATVVGLGGSAYHTVERAQARLQQYSNSGQRTLLAFLKEQSEDHRGRHRARPSESWPSEINDADHDNELPPEEIEFVAQQLCPEGFGHGYRAILGSPIYVARTGRPTTRAMMQQYNAIRQARWKQLYRPPLQLRGRAWHVGKPAFAVLAPLLEPDSMQQEPEQS